jgi:hypothetical protein
VLNRANGRLRLFKKEADFAVFEQVLTEARARVPLPRPSFCAAPRTQSVAAVIA